MAHEDGIEPPTNQWKPAALSLSYSCKIVRAEAVKAFNASRTSALVFYIQKNDTHLRQLLVESIGDRVGPDSYSHRLSGLDGLPGGILPSELTGLRRKVV